MNFRDIFNRLNEINENIRSRSTHLYHGTNIENLKDIQEMGLIPDFGSVVQSTEMYQYYMDDEYFNPDDRVDGVLFFSDSPDTWSYSHFGKTPDINEAALIIIENNETIYHKIKGGVVLDFNQQQVNNVDYIDIDKLPPFIENGDYFSFQEQEPIDILYGERLINFINKKTRTNARV